MKISWVPVLTPRQIGQVVTVLLHDKQRQKWKQGVMAIRLSLSKQTTHLDSSASTSAS